MPYWNTPKNAMVNLDSNTMLQRTGTKNIEFYEIEPAIVLDIILDKNHSYFKEQPQHTLNSQQWPLDVSGNIAKNKDPDYTWMGKALVRLYFSQQMVEKEDLVWAFPLESNISEYPLLNEIVGIVSYLGRYYYTRKINLFNWPNINADFSIEKSIGGFNSTSISPIDGNRELILDSNPNADYRPFQGPISYTSPKSNGQFKGVLGRYFYINKNIRSLKRREGDLVFESRFGTRSGLAPVEIGIEAWPASPTEPRKWVESCSARGVKVRHAVAGLQPHAVYDLHCDGRKAGSLEADGAGKVEFKCSLGHARPQRLELLIQ